MKIKQKYENFTQRTQSGLEMCSTGVYAGARGEEYKWDISLVYLAKMEKFSNPPPRPHPPPLFQPEASAFGERSCRPRVQRALASPGRCTCARFDKDALPGGLAAARPSPGFRFPAAAAVPGTRGIPRGSLRRRRPGTSGISATYRQQLRHVFFFSLSLSILFSSLRSTFSSLTGI